MSWELKFIAGGVVLVAICIAIGMFKSSRRKRRAAQVASSKFLAERTRLSQMADELLASNDHAIMPDTYYELPHYYDIHPDLEDKLRRAFMHVSHCVARNQRLDMVARIERNLAEAKDDFDLLVTQLDILAERSSWSKTEQDELDEVIDQVTADFSTLRAKLYTELEQTSDPASPVFDRWYAILSHWHDRESYDLALKYHGLEPLRFPPHWNDLVAQKFAHPFPGDFAGITDPSDLKNGQVRSMAVKALRDRDYTGAKIALAYADLAWDTDRGRRTHLPFRDEVGSILLTDLAKFILEQDTARAKTSPSA